MRHGGRYPEALELARTAGAEAEALAWPPLLAHARFVEGRCAMLVGRRAEAQALLMDAYFEALAVGSVEVAFRSARSLVSTLVREARFDDALVWSRHAEALASELDDPGELDAAEGHYLLGLIYTGLGEHERAIAEAARAEAMRSAALGPEHPLTAAASRTLGRAYLGAGRPREALVLFDAIAAGWAEALGPEHPYIADLARLRSQALFALGRHEQALARAQESLARYEALRGEQHPSLAPILRQLGDIHAALGHEDEAQASRARAQALAGPPKDPPLARSK
jgi:tetratricopeptide (TPR) repeat protein